MSEGPKVYLVLRQVVGLLEVAGDKEGADSIRDLMDFIWSSMSESERVMVRRHEHS